MSRSKHFFAESMHTRRYASTHCRGPAVAAKSLSMQDSEVSRVQRDLERVRQYIDRGNLAAAATAAEAATSRHTEVAVVWFWRALVAQLLNLHVEAIVHIERALALDSEHPEFYALLARSQSARGNVLRAVASALRAVSLEPKEPAVLEALGQIIVQGGAWPQALELFERASHTMPDQRSLLKARAWMHQAMGQDNAAVELLESVITRYPEHGPAHWALANIRPDDKRLLRLDKLARTLGEDNRDRDWIDYARYVEREAVGDDEVAIACLLRGAASCRKRIEFNAHRNTQVFAAMAKQLAESANAIDRVHAPWADESTPVPIFLIGMPRAGHSVTAALLSQSPEVHDSGESREFSICVKRVLGIESDVFLDEALCERLTTLDWTALGKLYRERLRRRFGGTGMIIERLPANYIYTAAIARALPEARLIRTVREPMDNCFSLYRQIQEVAHPFSYDQRELAQHYAAYDDWMRQIDAALPDRVLSVRYEQLVSAPAVVGRALARFCDISWHDDHVHLARTIQPQSAPPAVRVHAPIDATRLARWRRYESSLGVLQETLLKAGLGPMPAR